MNLEAQAVLVRDGSYQLKKVMMHAVSGDDLYLVVEQENGKFGFAKYLYSGDDKKEGIESTHYQTEYREFDTRGQACVYLSESLLQEEVGYAQGES